MTLSVVIVVKHDLKVVKVVKVVGNLLLDSELVCQFQEILHTVVEEQEEGRFFITILQEEGLHLKATLLLQHVNDRVVNYGKAVLQPIELIGTRQTENLFI